MGNQQGQPPNRYQPNQGWGSPQQPPQWQQPSVQYPRQPHEDQEFYPQEPPSQPQYPAQWQQQHPIPYGYYPPQQQYLSQWQQPYYPQQYPQPMPYGYYPPPPQPVYIVNQVSANAYAGYYRRPQQLSFLIRFLYFCFIGWWLGLVWISIALCFLASVIGIPIGVVMLRYTMQVLTLEQR